MKKFIRDWVLAPKVLPKVMKLKNKIIKSYDKSALNNELVNTEKGNRCFIVGTGSSIKQQNLKLLENEIVIGVSGLFNHDDIKIFNPKYYVNPPIFKDHSNYYGEEKFISYLSDMDEKLSNDTIMFFDVLDKKYIDKYKLFQNKKIIWKNYEIWDGLDIHNINIYSLPSIWSVSEGAIQVALYLGFDEVHLLGFDHDWFNGLFNYAFSNEKARKHFKETAEEVSEKHNVDSEFQMRRHARIFDKYKKLFAIKQNIYNSNANANSYVDTFPKVKYEDLFKK